MRFAGTCSRYSKRAIPQLASAATHQARVERFRRWAYQAKVMKTFEQARSATARAIGCMERETGDGRREMRRRAMAVQRAVAREIAARRRSELGEEPGARAGEVEDERPALAEDKPRRGFVVGGGALRVQLVLLDRDTRATGLAAGRRRRRSTTGAPPEGSASRRPGRSRGPGSARRRRQRPRSGDSSGRLMYQFRRFAR